MLRMFSVDALRSRVRNSALYIQMAVLAVAGVAPILNMGTVNAEQLTSRKVTISDSKSGATGVNYVFTFSAAAANFQSFVIQFCSTPLGSCTLPTGSGAGSAAMSVATATVTNSTGLTGTLSQTSSTSNACNDVTGGSRTMVCYNSTAATPGPLSGATITVGGVTNPTLGASSNNTTVYPRIYMYSTNDYQTLVHEGTVAASIQRQLTVNGRVQERLNFCVAAVADSGTVDTELPTTMAACSALATSVVDLGVIDNTVVAKSPVANNPPTSLGNASYGIAMLNTNASNGTSITYYAEQDTTSGATNQLRSFRVPGATCSATATSVTDQCFVSASASGENITNAVLPTAEKFGMNVPCVINYDGVTPAINSVATTTNNLTVNAPYNAEGTTTAAADCEKTEAANNKYAWNDTSTAAEIANSNTGSKVVDNEILKLNFGALAGATTPTGSYTVVSTYIATPTF